MSTIPYISTHSHTTFSFKDGYGHPEDLVKRAKELGMNAVATTDHGNISAHPLLEKAAKKHDVRPIFGTEFYLAGQGVEKRDKENRRSYHITTLAMNETGYKNMLKLVSLSFEKGFYYKNRIDEQMLFEHQEGLICYSGCYSGTLQNSLVNSDYNAALDEASRFKAVFGDRYYLEMQHYQVFQQTYEQLYRISEQLHIPVITTIDNHYLLPEDAKVRELLWFIRDRGEKRDEVSAEGASLIDGDALYEALRKIDPTWKWAPSIEISQEIADRCSVSLKKGALPKFPLPTGEKSAYLFLGKLCVEGLKRRGVFDLPAYKERLFFELNIIKEKGYEDYFLIVWDMLKWAKDNDILVGAGRGSVGGSLVAYALGITEGLDPLKYDLLFERFLALDRDDMPDIDSDFDHSKRDKVREYLQNKYGYDHVVQVGTFAQYKGKVSLNETAKFLEVPKDKIEVLKSHLMVRNAGDSNAHDTVIDTLNLNEDTREIFNEYPNLILASKLEGQYSHSGSHAAGVLLSSVPLSEIVAFYGKEGEEEKRIASVDMSGAKYLDLVKLDLLGIKELTMMKEIADANGLTLEDIYNIPLDDPLTIEGFNNVDVLGVFQAEGYASKKILQEMGCTSFNDIVDLMALHLPGPLDSGMTSLYIKRKQGKKAEGFDFHPKLAEITKDTQGQILYQEQIMRIARDIGNFTAAEANNLRSLVAKSQGREVIDNNYPHFHEGAIANGLTEEQTRHIWDSIVTFGRYGFNKAHSVAYAILCFQTMWAKQHYPLHFYLSHIKLEADEDKQKKLMKEAVKKGFKILGPRFGYSKATWNIDHEGNIRAGLEAIKGIAGVTASIIEERGYFTEIPEDISKRVKTILEKNVAYFEEQWDYFDIYPDKSIVEFKGDKCKNIDSGDACDLILRGNIKSAKLQNIRDKTGDKPISLPHLEKYAIATFEDDSGDVTILVNRKAYVDLSGIFWDAAKKGIPVTIKGKKAAGKRLISVNEIIR